MEGEGIVSDRLHSFKRDFLALLYKHGFERPVFVHEGIMFDHYAIGVPVDGSDDVYFGIGMACPACVDEDGQQESWTA